MTPSFSSVMPLALLLGFAVVTDSKERRIPNALTALTFALGLVTRGVLDGPSGLTSALLGAGVACGLMLPGWLLGGMGAGDVKLMAAAGAWLGPVGALYGVLFSLIAGGVFAAVVALRRGVLQRALFGAAVLGTQALASVARSDPRLEPSFTTGVRFPFAGAVMIGALAAFGVRT